jgi:hypothetical protein
MFGLGEEGKQRERPVVCAGKKGFLFGCCDCVNIVCSARLWEIPTGRALATGKPMDGKLNFFCILK